MTRSKSAPSAPSVQLTPHEVRAEKNQRTLNSIKELLQLLMRAGAIVGRTDSDIVLRATCLPPILSDDTIETFLALRLEGEDCSIPVICDKHANSAYVILGIYSLELSLIVDRGPAAITSEEVPCIEEMRRELSRIQRTKGFLLSEVESVRQTANFREWARLCAKAKEGNHELSKETGSPTVTDASHRANVH